MTSFATHFSLMSVTMYLVVDKYWDLPQNEVIAVVLEEDGVFSLRMTPFSFIMPQ